MENPKVFLRISNGLNKKRSDVHSFFIYYFRSQNHETLKSPSHILLRCWSHHRPKPRACRLQVLCSFYSSWYFRQGAPHRTPLPKHFHLLFSLLFSFLFFSLTCKDSIYFLILQKTSKNLEVSDIFSNFATDKNSPQRYFRWFLHQSNPPAGKYLGRQPSVKTTQTVVEFLNTQAFGLGVFEL